MSVALLLGGGAPTLTLQSGALAALDEKGAEFSVVSTAGAGMVIGLLYAAPKGMTRQEALANTVNMGVDDAIYNQFPVNFKVFHKPGLAADQYRSFLQMLPRAQLGDTPAERLFSDWMGLMFSAFCPSDLSPQSKGLCEHAPWIEDIVDFDQLKNFDGEFYMNAYNLTDGEMVTFPEADITPDHFRAALAFPFIYPPFKLKGKTYIEGSAIDTLCFDGLLQYREERREREKDKTDRKPDLPSLKTVVIFDVLSSKKIIREPRNLYDAWIQSIMIPLVEIAKDDLELFKYRHMVKLDREELKLFENRADGKSDNEKWKLNLLEMKFDDYIPEHQWPYVLDWSYSNLKTLYDAGYQAGLDFYEKNKDDLRPRKPAKSKKPVESPELET
ncbi:MAG: patatin-like phospholipase family protein [Desulfatiglandales bacterium]